MATTEEKIEEVNTVLKGMINGFAMVVDTDTGHMELKTFGESMSPTMMIGWFETIKLKCFETNFGESE